MTLRWAVASGDWANTATWNGGTVPGVGDDVRTNGFVVDIAASISVDTLSCKDISNGTSSPGGRFTITPGSGVTLTVALGILFEDLRYSASDTSFITILAGTGPVTFTSTQIHGAWGTNCRTIAIASGYSGAVTINAEVFGGWRGPALDIQTGSTPSQITINGNVKGPENSGFTGNPSTLYVNVPALIHIYGDVIGGIIANAHSAIRVLSNALNTTIYVHGEVRGGPAATAIGQTAIDLSPSSTGTGYLYVEGNITATVGGAAITSSGATRIWASGVEVTALGTYAAISHTALTPVRPIQISGLISMGTTGLLAIQGPFVAIAGEPLDIFLRDDSNYPSNMNGTPVQLTSAVLGTNVLVDGNATEVEARAVGMLFAVEETDPDHVVLGMPSAIDSPDVLVLAEQVQEVFAPATVPDVGSGWLTVIAKGLVGLADSSDPGGGPDYIVVVGSVVLTPSLTKPIRRLSTGEMLVVSSVTATFDSNGELSYDGVKDVRVVAPGWTDLSNTAWRWSVTVQPGPGQSWGSFSGSFTDVPGTTFDLSSLL